MSQKKKTEHYVDNKRMLEVIIEWKADREKALEAGEEEPAMPDELGKMIMMICQRLNHRPNFLNYSYNDEFVSDGIENCIRYAKNFDPEKSKNPFAYFSQVSFFASIRRINKEKKQFATKAKMVQQSGVLAIGAESFTQNHDNAGDYANGYRDFLRDFYDVELLPEKEKKPRKIKQAKEPNTIDVTKA